MTLPLTHKAPLSIVDRHLMEAGGVAALAGILAGAGPQEVRPILLGPGLQIVDSVLDVAGAAGVSWGAITGTLSDQSDLQAALDAKSNVGHVHSFASLSGIPTTIAGYGITDFNSLGDARWVNVTGDTMTGTLTLDTGVASESKASISALGFTSYPTATIGTYARGHWVAKWSNGAFLAGSGYYGTAENAPDYFYVGFGTTPWTSLFRVSSAGHLGINVAPDATFKVYVKGDDNYDSVVVSDGKGAAFRARNLASPRYRSDWFVDSGNNATINCYDDTGAVYGNVTLDGVHVILNQGKLKFPATQNASSDANALDDYEEGTWTAVPTPASGSITSYTVHTATYTKVGRLVTVTFDFTISDKGTGSNVLNVTGLPFTSANNCSASVAETGVAGASMAAWVSGAAVSMIKYDGNSFSVFANGMRFHGTASYIV